MIRVYMHIWNINEVPFEQVLLYANEKERTNEGTCHLLC
jgi:hypothetical protein